MDVWTKVVSGAEYRVSSSGQSTFWLECPCGWRGKIPITTTVFNCQGCGRQHTLLEEDRQYLLEMHPDILAYQAEGAHRGIEDYRCNCESCETHRERERLYGA